MKTISTASMEHVNAGIVFSEKWCDENEKKIASVGLGAFGIGLIPTPPTVFWGALIGGTMTLIGFACAY